mgnify:CR=1 FL=1
MAKHAADIYELREKDTEEDNEFEGLNSKVAGGLYKLLSQSGNFRQEVRVVEAKYQMEHHSMLNGRQIYHLMTKHFETNSAADALYDLETIHNVELKGDDLEGFQNTWDGNA